MRRAPTAAEARLTLAAEAADVVLHAANTVVRVDRDTVLEESSPATVDGGFRVRTEQTGTLADPYEALTLSLVGEAGSLAADGTLSRVSDGTVRVEARGRYAAASVTLELQRKSGATTVTRTGWADGSLAAAAAGIADPLAAGAGPDDRWAQSVDLSCISQERPRATLIHPQVALGVEHYRPPGTLTFRDASGIDHTRQVAARRDVGVPNAQDGYRTDLAVCVLDSPLPASVRPALLPPTDLESLLPGVAHRVTGLRTDQEGKHLGGVLVRLQPGVRWRQPDEGQPGRESYEPLISGDSGSPAFLLLPEGPLLTTLWTGGGGGSGPRLHALLPEMQAAVDAATAAAGVTLSPLSPADLSAYASYA